MSDLFGNYIVGFPTRWLIYEAHYEYRDILLTCKSPIKWRQRPDMTIAVDWDVKHQFKQTNKTSQILP